MIKTYLDYFCKYRARRMILRYEFAIYTSNSKPIFYKKPAYGPYKYKIIMDQVQKSLANILIK